MTTLMALAAGFLLDLIFGDPRWLPHPIRLMGFMIAKGEDILRKISCKSEKSRLASGMVLTIVIALLWFVVPFALLQLLRQINGILAFAAETFMCYQILAAKSLKGESMKVYDELEKGDLQGARRMLSYIVGRDTDDLNPEQVTKGAVETVAENTSDGVVAPLIFILVGGAPLGLLYKAVNTMDSMIGYKNSKYMEFGRFAAKLDDVLNYIPARISGYLMILAAFFLGYDGKAAYRIYRRDKRNHSSPNSAHTESACAGALGIQLAGSSFYFGKLVEKPTIGDPVRPVEPLDILRSNNLMYGTALLSMILGGAVKLLFLLLFWN